MKKIYQFLILGLVLLVLTTAPTSAGFWDIFKGTETATAKENTEKIQEPKTVPIEYMGVVDEPVKEKLDEYKPTSQDGGEGEKAQKITEQTKEGYTYEIRKFHPTLHQILAPGEKINMPWEGYVEFRGIETQPGGERCHLNIRPPTIGNEGVGMAVASLNAGELKVIKSNAGDIVVGVTAMGEDYCAVLVRYTEEITLPTMVDSSPPSKQAEQIEEDLAETSGESSTTDSVSGGGGSSPLVMKGGSTTTN